MSLWTPGGEHPVDRGDGPAGPTPMGQNLSADQEAEARQIAAEMQQVRDQLSQVPAAVVIANHAMGCYELAAIHLSNQPPKLAEAQLAIDAFAAILDAIRGHLGPDEATLDDALAQIRLAFVQVKASADAAVADAGAVVADAAADAAGDDPAADAEAALADAEAVVADAAAEDAASDS